MSPKTNGTEDNTIYNASLLGSLTNSHHPLKPERLLHDTKLFHFDNLLSFRKTRFSRGSFDTRLIPLSLLFLALFQFESSRRSIQQLEQHPSFMIQEKLSPTITRQNSQIIEKSSVRRKITISRNSVGSHHIGLWLDDDGFNNIRKIDLNQYETLEKESLERRRELITYPANADWTICVEGSPPMYDWQDSFYPSCNNVHEVDLDVSQRRKGRDTASQLVNAGWNRDVWELIFADNSKFALKSLRYDREFNLYMFDQQRIDAVVSERLTSSNYIANIYGFCGFSALFDYSSEGTLEEQYRGIKKKDRLRVAHRLARALADVHTFGGGEFSPIIHADMDARQYIMINGDYYLNDFNTARLLRWDKLKQKPCPGIMKNHPTDCNRSPDENLIIGWNEVYEGVDVYSLGNQFYKLLMNDAKHKGLSTSGCLKAIREGDIPILPDSYEQSTDPIDIALIHVMKRSLQFDPKERASALELANYLEDALIKMEKQSKQ